MYAFVLVPSSYPDGLSCTVLSSRSIKLSWDQIKDEDKNGLVKGYKVYYNRVNKIKCKLRRKCMTCFVTDKILYLNWMLIPFDHNMFKSKYKSCH